MPALRSLLAAVDAYQQRRRWLALPFAVVLKTINDQGGSLAALIAYYGFLSTFPLLLLFAAILGFVLVGDPSLQAHVLGTTEHSFPVASGYLRSVVSGNGAALGIGVVGALWTGLGVARATERAMNAVWDIPMADRPNLWWSRARALLMLVVLGVTFLVSSALAALQQVHGVLEVPSRVLGTAGPLALNFGLYLMAFQVLTNRHLAWRDIVPGAALGAVGWTLLQSLGAYYTHHVVAHASHLYGSLAAVIGLLAWLYLGAQLTIYAAQVNVVLTYRLWPRSLVRGVHTEGDRRALVRQVGEAQRTADEVITVHFTTSHDAPPGDVTPPVAAPDGRTHEDASDEDTRAVAEETMVRSDDLSERALATHVAITALIGHLGAYDALRQQIDAAQGEDADRPRTTGRGRDAPRAGDTSQLRARAEVESAGISRALQRLAAREARIAEALQDLAVQPFGTKRLPER